MVCRILVFIWPSGDYFHKFDRTPLFRRSGAGLVKSKFRDAKIIPGKPVAYNYGLLSTNNGLLWGIVANYFGLLGVPGKVDRSPTGLWGASWGCWGLGALIYSLKED